MSKNVFHPPHYNAHPSGVECIEIVEHMNFNLGNVVKYCWRADEKGKDLEDLRKAEFYIQREIAKRIAASKGLTTEEYLNNESAPQERSGVYGEGRTDDS